MKKYFALSFIALGLGLTSCNDFLDKLPDDRAELNNNEKVTKFLVSAYVNNLPDFIFEMGSDNVLDNGAQYTAQPNQDKIYHWEDVETENNDDPRSLWNGGYEAAAAANEALAAIGDNPALRGQRAEALLCRAYAMFQTANIFCMAYNPEKADEYMGIPYPKAPGVTVDDRGTLRETYDNINADIEEALPLLDDNHITVPKYHFTTKAAYAFAARFNLFYHQYDKAIEYASRVLGSSPAGMLRNLEAYQGLGASDFCNHYLRSSETANIMILNGYSIAGRAPYSSSYRRYAQARDIVLNETFWAAMPWGSGSGANTLWASHKLYGSNQGVYYPKMIEQFEITDQVNQTGYAHIVDCIFTTDETLLVRAEAYALKKDFANAIADMNTWIGSHCEASRTSGGTTARRPTLTEENINSFVNATPTMKLIPEKAADRSWKKAIAPQGFTVEAGTQENVIQLILHMRRIETIHQGLRWLDIKRYGIAFSHNLDGEDAIVFEAGDLRGAIQLPNDVIDAGLPANPRAKATEETTEETNE